MSILDHTYSYSLMRHFTLATYLITWQAAGSISCAQFQTEGLLQLLEHAIRYQFLPSLTEGLILRDDEKDMFALPVQLWCLKIVIPAKYPQHWLNSLLKLSDPLLSLIRQMTTVI